MLVLLSAPLATLAQSTALGPLTWTESAPLQRFAATPGAEPIHPVGAGRLRIGVWTGYTNVFERDSADAHEPVRDDADAHELFLDFEQLLSVVTVAYGASDRVELRGALAWETTGGGVLDGFLLRIHDAVGAGTRNRRLYPADRHVAYMKDYGGSLRLVLPRRMLTLSDLTLGAKWLGLGGPGSSGALSVRGSVRLPVHEHLLGRERASAEGSLLATRAWRGWHLHGMVGGAAARPAPELDDVLAPWVWAAMVGAERALSGATALLLQYSVARSLVRGIGDDDVDGLYRNVVFGLVGEPGGGWRWEASMQEDIPPSGPAMDFTVQLGVSRAW